MNIEILFWSLIITLVIFKAYKMINNFRHIGDLKQIGDILSRMNEMARAGDFTGFDDIVKEVDTIKYDGVFKKKLMKSIKLVEKMRSVGKISNNKLNNKVIKINMSDDNKDNKDFIKKLGKIVNKHAGKGGRLKDGSFIKKGGGMISGRVAKEVLEDISKLNLDEMGIPKEEQAFLRRKIEESNKVRDMFNNNGEMVRKIYKISGALKEMIDTGEKNIDIGMIADFTEAAIASLVCDGHISVNTEKQREAYLKKDEEKEEKGEKKK